MKVTFLGTTSDSGSCPTVYETDRGTYLVQGSIVTDEDALTEVRKHGNGIPNDETLVEIPRELANFFRHD